jgi:outer membrane lipopolysaccharide assembly protein LptE/RlpB
MFTVTETFKGATNVYADNVESLDRAIELARGGVEQEFQNGYHVVFQVVDAAGAVVYDSDADTDPRAAFFRDNANVINPPPMPK